MPRKITIRVEFQTEDAVWVATCDDLVGLVVQENSLEDCCQTAQAVAKDMLAQYADIEKTALVIDFSIETGD